MNIPLTQVLCMSWLADDISFLISGSERICLPREMMYEEQCQVQILAWPLMSSEPPRDRLTSLSFGFPFLCPLSVAVVRIRWKPISAGSLVMKTRDLPISPPNN